MDQRSIGVLIRDGEFAERFADYVRSSPYRNRVRLKLFTDPDAVELHAEECGKLDALLTGSDFDGQFRTDRGRRLASRVFELTEDPDSGDDPLRLYQYQPANRMLEIILSSLEGNAGDGAAGGNRRGCRILSVYSAAGSSGKTTVAVHAAKLLAETHPRVGYLSLESVPSPPVFRIGSEDGFERLMYYAKADPGVMAAKWHQYVTQDPLTKVYGVPPALHPEELEEMSRKDTVELLNAFSANDLLDILVLDLDSYLHPRVTAGLAASDRILWLVKDGLHSLHKTASVKRELSRWADEGKGYPLEKAGFVLNQSEGTPVHDPNTFGIRIEEALPDQPEWRVLRNPDGQWIRTGFHDRLSRWLYRNLPPADRVDRTGGER